jgi:hypothetical protein
MSAHDIDEKISPDHMEIAQGGDDRITKPDVLDTIVVAPHLGPFSTIRKYPKVALLCFIAALSGTSDGYQVGLSGSIIALPYVDIIEPDDKGDSWLNLDILQALMGPWY